MFGCQVLVQEDLVLVVVGYVLTFDQLIRTRDKLVFFRGVIDTCNHQATSKMFGTVRCQIFLGIWRFDEFIASQIPNSVDAFNIRLDSLVFSDFFDIFTLNIPSTTWRTLIDATVNLHGKTIGDIFKGLLRSLGSSSLDGQADQTQARHEENNQEDDNRFEKLPCNIGKCVV